jgi:hypothetical protein
MKKLLLLPLLLFFTLPAVAQKSASGSRGSSSSATTVKSLLISHSWRIVYATMANGRMMGEIEPGTLHMMGDDGDTHIDTTLVSDEVKLSISFKGNGTFTIDVRLPGYSDLESGRWKLSKDRTRIILSEKNKRSIEYRIEQLDSERAVFAIADEASGAGSDDETIVKYELVSRE